MQVRAAGGVVDWWSLGGLVGLELGIAVGGEGLARLSSLFESLLGDLFSNRISVRLMEHAATLDLAQYEDSETYDHLERARRQTVGRIGLVALLLSTAQDLVTLISLAAVRSEEHTSELQSLAYLVCRLLLEKKKKKQQSEMQYACIVSSSM